MAKYKFDQRRYDFSADTFNDFLNKYKKVAKQAFEDRSSDIMDTFLFSKLLVQMQNELAMEGKHDAMMEEIRTFVQRRCQYAQLLPVTSSAQPFNQISAPQPHRVTSQTSNSQLQQTMEAKGILDGQCRHCGIHGHKWAECRKRIREENQNKPANQSSQNTAQPNQAQDNKPKHNPNLYAKSVAKWDTRPEIVTTGLRQHQHMETNGILNSQRMKTSNSEETSDKPKTELTMPMNCSTQQPTKPTALTKWKDPMTRRIQNCLKPRHLVQSNKSGRQNQQLTTPTQTRLKTSNDMVWQSRSSTYTKLTTDSVITRRSTDNYTIRPPKKQPTTRSQQHGIVTSEQ